MKKLGLLLVGGFAVAVAISHLGSMIGLALSLALTYYAVKRFMKAESTGAKIGWGIFGFLALMASASNVPAIMGIAAAYVVYLIYKNWNKTEAVVKEEADPFVNFEKQWAEMNNR